MAARILLDFIRRQALSSAFAIGLLFAIAATDLVGPLPVARYDLLFLFCLFLQAALLRLRWESWREVGILSIFHLVGVLLEWVKVRGGSWSYPEDAIFKAYGVPFYSGFMYASIASYMSQSWRRLDLEFVRWPKKWLLAMVLAAVYGQFFLPIQRLSIRYVTLAVVLVAFSRTWVTFTSGDRRLRMPLSSSFLLIGSAVYLAENFATYFHAWAYPNQEAGWQPVHISKVISWTLLMVVSMTIVHAYHLRFGVTRFQPTGRRQAHNE
ncbi:MAG: DUF817 family protein [Alphaproteobacteria bacterium]|nr:MAG: DUF817 family protein [Alphaproteobacteria bacterium]